VVADLDGWDRSEEVIYGMTRPGAGSLYGMAGRQTRQDGSLYGMARRQTRYDGRHSRNLHGQDGVSDRTMIHDISRGEDLQHLIFEH
jgi:hypothetical protein